MTPSDSKPGSRPAGFLERTITRLFMRPVGVARVIRLSDHFRLVYFEGDALKECSWSPGDKVEVKLGKGLLRRTYTPTHWDRGTGTTRILAYCHGAGPGSEWARRVVAGDEQHLIGPHRSLKLVGLASTTILFGDETSFALALALQRQGEPGAERRFVFEVNARQEAASVLKRLGLAAAIVVQRRSGNEHLREVSDAMLGLMEPTSTFVLSGKASSIQHVSRALKANGVDTRRLRTKAYWAPGKVGLD